MENKKKINVEVAYARPDEQVIIPVKVDDGASIEEAVKVSGIIEQFPEIDISKNKVGVFGKLSKLNAPLRAGDRVEIYRPLIADPKEVRRQRAAEGKQMKKGGGAIQAEAEKESPGNRDPGEDVSDAEQQ